MAVCAGPIRATTDGVRLTDIRGSRFLVAPRAERGSIELTNESAEPVPVGVQFQGTGGNVSRVLAAGETWRLGPVAGAKASF